jgi:3-oxoacyl-[acyl-carrier-protein] synthase-1
MKVYVAADSIISPLGLNTKENLQAVIKGESGIALLDGKRSSTPVYASAINNFADLEGGFTRFEKLCIASIKDALSKTDVHLSLSDAVFVLSTTKGNIELIEDGPVDEKLRRRVSLFNTAETISKYFGAVNKPLAVSNACISGLLSVIVAKRLLQSGKYKHAVITGAEVLSHFVVSGFQALHAMSAKPCKPFDKNRDGINLGECSATMVLTTDPVLVKDSAKVWVNGMASSNDANHISGPSRTGAELAFAINGAMRDSGIKPDEISSISAHGTATLYNDEMEAKAFTLSGMAEVPVYSLKGNFGHTLGAAGVLESILCYRSLQEGIVLPSKNFDELGVSAALNISRRVSKTNKNHVLKTASGFGGCNAAVVYSIN